MDLKERRKVVIVNWKDETGMHQDNGATGSTAVHIPLHIFTSRLRKVGYSTAKHSEAQHSKHGMSDGVCFSDSHSFSGKASKQARKHLFGFRLYWFFTSYPLYNVTLLDNVFGLLSLYIVHTASQLLDWELVLSDVNVEMILCVDRLVGTIRCFG